MVFFPKFPNNSLSLVEFCRSSIGAKLFPDVLLNDMAGPEGSPLILSLKLAVDVLVSNKTEADIC